MHAIFSAQPVVKNCSYIIICPVYVLFLFLKWRNKVQTKSFCTKLNRNPSYRCSHKVASRGYINAILLVNGERTNRRIEKWLYMNAQMCTSPEKRTYNMFGLMQCCPRTLAHARIALHEWVHGLILQFTIHNLKKIPMFAHFNRTKCIFKQWNSRILSNDALALALSLSLCMGSSRFNYICT